MAPTYSKAEFIKYITDKHPILDILQHIHTSHFLPNSAFIDVKPPLSGDIKPYPNASIHASIQLLHIIDEPYPHMTSSTTIQIMTPTLLTYQHKHREARKPIA
jgi:hypothetical protein